MLCRSPLIRPGWPDGHNVRPAVGALARQDERADAVLRGASKLEVGVAGRRIDDDPLAVQDVLALADDDISGQRNRLLLEIVDAEVAAAFWSWK